MAKDNPKDATKENLKESNCACTFCMHYYSQYDAHAKIINRNGEKMAVMSSLCYCIVHQIGLPYFQDADGKICPDVLTCQSYEELKED